MKYIKLIKQSTIAMTLIGIGVATNSTVLAADGGEYNSNGIVEFISGSSITDPVDPENPDPENPVKPIDPTNPSGPNPGTEGPLTIDYASSLDFGQNKISNKDEIYYANAQGFAEGGLIAGEFRGNYVQVTDNRGNNGGWTLSLKQEGQFKNDAAKQYKEITGAKISISNSVANSNLESVIAPSVKNISLDPAGATSIIMSAENGAGTGTWVDNFGKAEEMSIDGKKIQKNKAVTLDIPGVSQVEVLKYTTKLTWTLTDVPGTK